MKSNVLGVVLAAVGLLSAPVSAHHGAASFDTTRELTLKGTVTEFAWQNPHPMITVEVRTNDGKVEKWLIGGPAINRMEANGWNRTTVKVGEVITGTGYQFADGQKIVRLERVVLADGKEMRLYAR